MKNLINKRVISFLLSVLLLVGMLPTGASATGIGRFVLVVESGGELVIAPEFVSYGEGQTIREALAASGHTFTGLENDWIVEIDGVGGNYRRSDENGGFDLGLPAAEIAYFRFSEEVDSRPSEGLQRLMSAMADYREKPMDVQAAAKEDYDAAYNEFVGLDSASAALLADRLTEAICTYENNQAGETFAVTFTDGQTAHCGVSITVENPYGKVWTDEGDGVLNLPADTYSFCVGAEGLWVEGSITVTENMRVAAALPESVWLKLDTIRFSGSYGAEENEENRFSDDEYTCGQWNGRKNTIAVPDTFNGRIYTYAEYDANQLDTTPTLTAIYTSAQNGENLTQVIPFESFTSGAANVLTRGALGNTVIYRVSSTGENGYIYSQDYTVEFARVPTLASIRVADQNGVDQTANTAFEGDLNEYTYKVVDTVTAVTVKAEGLDSSYAVTVNGQNAAQGVTVEVNGETQILVEVTAGAYSNTYTLKILPGEGRNLSFVTERSDVTIEVVNSNGEVLPFEKFREGTSGNRYQYVLVPGETYSYVATADTYYHVADEFTMEDVADSTIRVDVPMTDWLNALAFGTKTGSSSKNNLPLDTSFSPQDHSYEVQYVDTEHNVYIWAAADADLKIQAMYSQKFASALYHEKEIIQEITSGKSTGLWLKRLLMDENPIENTVTIRLEKEVDGIRYYQDYQVAIKRTLTLKNMSATCAGAQITLTREDGEMGFDPLVKEYSVTVSMHAEELELALSAYTDNCCYGEAEVGYRVKVDGIDVTQSAQAKIPLNGTIETQTVTVCVENEKALEGTTQYTLHVLKSPPVDVTFQIAPENALLAVYEAMSGQRLWKNEAGVFEFCEGYSYRYALTAYGYVSKSGVLQVTRDENKALVIIDGEQIYPVAETEEGGALTMTWELEKAQVNGDIQRDLVAEWENFRGDSTNNAITDAAIPTAAENGTLYWANQLGSGFDDDAVGSPIVVDGDLITYASDEIYRVDTITGEIKRTGKMDHKSNFSITPPSYAEGMVFVALSDGTVQAFNAVTLESLWLYKDPLGGQPNSPLTIHDGYLYTGFWNSETGDANFVCLSITDEDPARGKESKSASWYYTAKGGFYWSGAYVCDDYVLVGTDDGTNSCVGQSSSMLAFAPQTGELLASWENLNGDIRSSVVYDAATDAYYFTSKGGGFYALQMVNTDGKWQMVNQWNVALQNGSNATPMSTCSPAVYNGRAYVGVSGAGQFAAYSGHNITVIDLNQKKIAYSVQTQGYPQTSGLLTTAYEQESGYVYIYFFDNMTPGKLRVLRDKAGQSKADYVTVEEGGVTAYAVFTPTGDHAQYAICSPIVDKFGTVYFKNDSAHLMAFGSAIKKIQVTTQPDKMVYADGDRFDPAGMVVTATYANGMTRDVTDYVIWDTETVTAEHTTITISFPYVMYHNEEDGQKMVAGVSTATPVTTLSVSIGQTPGALGDVNLDAQIDQEDVDLIVSWFYGKIELTEEQVAVADVNGDGEADIRDANLLVSFFCGTIHDFTANG